MNTYAKPVKKMNIHQIVTAEVEAEKFGKETGHKFVNIEKVYKSGYCANFEDDETGGCVTASVVICPNCGEIQVCWGEYGDPETEICICSNCKQNYTIEPF